MVPGIDDGSGKDRSGGRTPRGEGVEEEAAAEEEEEQEGYGYCYGRPHLVRHTGGLSILRTLPPPPPPRSQVSSGSSSSALASPLPSVPFCTSPVPLVDLIRHWGVVCEVTVLPYFPSPPLVGIASPLSFAEWGTVQMGVPRGQKKKKRPPTKNHRKEKKEAEVEEEDVEDAEESEEEESEESEEANKDENGCLSPGGLWPMGTMHFRVRHRCCMRC